MFYALEKGHHFIVAEESGQCSQFAHALNKVS